MYLSIDKLFKFFYFPNVYQYINVVTQRVHLYLIVGYIILNIDDIDLSIIL